MLSVFTEIVYQSEKGNDTVLVTVIADKGSAPRGKGSIMAVNAAGRLSGTVGGGAVEFDAVTVAQNLLKQNKEYFIKEYTLTAAGEIGMVCGGDVTLLFTRFSAADTKVLALTRDVLAAIREKKPGTLSFYNDGTFPTLHAPEDGKTPVFSLPLPIGERAVLFGGGHIAAALCPLLTGVGFRVTVMDCREEYANRERFTEAEQVICAPYEDISVIPNLGAKDYIVIMTNGHAFDLTVEDQILRLDTAYVGVIGSRSKIAAVNAKLSALGIAEDKIASVHTPIGTPIKAVTPEEIAISIAGEMILCRALNREKAGELPSHACPMH